MQRVSQHHGWLKSFSFLFLLVGIQLPISWETAKSSNLLPQSEIGRKTLAQSSSSKPQAASTTVCPAQLEQTLDNLLIQKYGAIASRAYVGVLVQTLSSAPSSRRTLYNRNAQKYFVPASNAKVLTTAAVLHSLGSQFRTSTSVYRVNTQPNLVVLRVVGRGDPSITDASLQALAQQLSQQGIRRIDRLIADASYFQGEATPLTWEWGDAQVGYGASITGLMVNQNAIDLQLYPQAIGQPLRVQWEDPLDAVGWRIENRSVTVDDTQPEFLDVGRDLGRPILQVKGQLQAGAPPEPVAVAVLDPTQHFLRHFQRSLATQQILVARMLSEPAPHDVAGIELASLNSPPLAELLAETNQASNNLYAEALLRLLGVNDSTAQTDPANTLATAERGLVALRDALTQLGVDPEGYRLVDGSGLSRHNLVSPEALVQTLQAIARTPEANVYRASLPVAGVSGTLQGRFQNTAAQGIVQAKTGTLSGVTALSGYVNSRAYDPLVFSIIVNHSEQSSSALRQLVDEMVVTLTQLKRC